MGVIKLDGLPIEQPAAEPWPVDEHTIRIDEMFARQLDNAFSAGVRGLLHDPETGIAAQSGEAALHAIAGAMPALRVSRSARWPGPWGHVSAALSNR